MKVLSTCLAIRVALDGSPDFVKAAEAYGYLGMRVEKPAELEPVLCKAFALKDQL